MNTSKLSAYALLFCLVAGCSTPPVTGDIRPTADRSQKLLLMAVTEAGQIKEVDPRLTRQLNLADQQIQRDWNSDAKNTLTDARATLEGPDAALLNDHARISGWVAISELSRSINDKSTAQVAIHKAVKELNKLPNPADRCQYVMGIANEMQYIEGRAAAAKTLEAAAPWTRSIDNVATRRQAVVAFASALFNLDEYSVGQSMIRQEGDAGWRSDILAKMAAVQPRPVALKAGSAYQPRSPMAAEEVRLERDSDVDTYFGKSLQYRSVFQNQRQSNTSK